MVGAWLLWAVLVLGQTTENSPFTRLGLGQVTDNNFNHLKHMGGLGASFIDAYNINFVNPASYAFLRATAFDMNLFARKAWLEDSQNRSEFWTGNLEYMSLAFPLRNPINELYDGVKRNYKWGMAFTLAPHSTVNYNIGQQELLPNGEGFFRNYRGEGGTYKFMWGNALRYKDISLGVNAGYLFGNMSYNRDIYFDREGYYDDFFTNEYNINGFLWNAGLMYSLVLNPGQIEKVKTSAVQKMTFGLHGNSATSFNTNSSTIHLLRQRFANQNNVDTILDVSDISGRGRLPAEWGAGVTYYYGEKWALGLNYTTGLWSSYFNDATDEPAGSLRNSSRYSLGGFFRPDYKSFDSFLKRVYYRYGFFYNTDPRVVGDMQINTVAATLGMGMPFIFQRKVSHLNLGVEAGIRGGDLPVSERYVKISLGVTFNDDEWFLKRKYN